MSPISPERWPNLEFTERGLTRLHEVLYFCDQTDEHPQVLAELLDRMKYLNDFGGSVSDIDARRKFRVQLGWDFAPLSFSLCWQRLDSSSDEYVYAFNGGLIWHGGSNDPLCISLTPQLWGIHT